jgi:hypothetical protein
MLSSGVEMSDTEERVRPITDYPMYAGDIYEIEISTGEVAYSLPPMVHSVIVEDGLIVTAYTQDLQAGMFIQAGEQVAQITAVNKMLYVGRLNKNAIGFFLSEDDDTVTRKRFTRDIYTDGRIVWHYVVIDEDAPTGSLDDDGDGDVIA